MQLCHEDYCWIVVGVFNTLRPRQNGRHFADDTFKRISLNENVKISIKISLKFVPEGPINNIAALVQMMAWHRPGDKPLSEPMMVSPLTHICVTRPQWVKRRLSPSIISLYNLTCIRTIRLYIIVMYNCNGLYSIRDPAMNWTNAHLLSIGKVSNIWIKTTVCCQEKAIENVSKMVI